MRRLQWRARALDDLGRIHSWLQTLERSEPDQTIHRIRVVAESLARLGDIGRPGSVHGVRELSVRTSPYVIDCVIAGEVIDILADYHTSQTR